MKETWIFNYSAALWIPGFPNRGPVEFCEGLVFWGQAAENPLPPINLPGSSSGEYPSDFGTVSVVSLPGEGDDQLEGILH